MVFNLLAQSIISGAAGDPRKGSFWFPEQGSATAIQSDWLFGFVLWISIFFMVLITGLMLTFIWKYRRRPGVKAERTATHNTTLELTWTIIPSILCVFIYYFGISAYIDIRTPPMNANEVQVTGQKWKWLFTYPNGLISSDLHVPVNEATRLTMRSEDVIHSLYIPAFREKMDVVPGRYSKMWFTPLAIGEHQIFCAEYCGMDHSRMQAHVIVHSRPDYEKWMRDAEEASSNMPPVELGASLYKQRGCMSCHSVDGTRGIGPSFKGIYGEKQELADGTSVMVDEDYIHESIIEPMAKVVKGFAPVMPTFKGKLKDKEIAGLIEYIKSLK